MYRILFQSRAIRYIRILLYLNRFRIFGVICGYPTMGKWKQTYGNGRQYKGEEHEVERACSHNSFSSEKVSRMEREGRDDQQRLFQ